MPPQSPFTRALVVANPIAGRGSGKANATQVADGLTALGIDTELFLTSGRGDATRRVAQMGESVDLVVSVGGDGTLGEVLTSLPTHVPVAVLPMGTANVMGVDLRLPRKPAGLLGLIQAGESTRLDTARVNGSLSFLVTGIGIDGSIVKDVEERRSGPITKSFYVRSVLNTIRRYQAPELTVEVDGRRLPGTYAWVLISNIIGYGGVLRLSAERLLDDGLFEVFPFPRGSRTALLGYGLRGLLRLLPGRSCKMVRAARVRVEADRPTPYQVDGDYAGETPVDFVVAPEQHRLIVP